MLELNGVVLNFGDKQVLKDFSLTVQPGRRIALMGPSGCGKTTALRVAMGLVKPQKGRVNNQFSKTAVVFQEPRLLPWRTAEENINLVLGDGQDTLDRARAWLQEMGLGDAGKLYPGELSGGMQQRVALARAMAADGDLLILDEPFKGLDEGLRLDVMAAVGRTKAAVLLVTHDVREAEALGCEILQMGNSE